MSAFAFQTAPVVLLAWLLCTPYLLVAVGQSLGTYAGAIRLVLYNAAILTIFCGFWYLGFYLSEWWMDLIDFGAPWSWLAALFAGSYGASFFLLRKYPKAIAKSFAGPAITTPPFWVWISFCAIKFDPNW